MRALTLMLKIFWSPGEAFAQIKESKVGPWIPMLTLVAFSLAATTIFLSVADLGELFFRQIQQSPQGGEISREALENLRETLVDNPFVNIVAYAGAVILPILMLVVTSVYFGLFLVLGSRGKFMQFWSVTAFSFMPLLLGSLAGFVVVFTTPPAALELQRMNVLTAATFIPLESGETAGVLFVFLQTLSLPTFWTLSLLVIGYGVIASKRISAVTRTIVVFIPWLITVGLRVGATWIFS